MNHEVQIYEIAPDATPAERPRATERIAVAGATVEEARAAALERLRAEGRVVRSLSCVSGGGLAAVVFSPAPPVPPISSVRTALRGVRGR